MQSSPSFDPSTFSLLDDSFGLCPPTHAPDRWSHFLDNITRLNDNADELTTYKVHPPFTACLPATSRAGSGGARLAVRGKRLSRCVMLMTTARLPPQVFYLARHGQGWHNVAEAKYGTEAWNNYWSRVNTDGEMTVRSPSPPLPAVDLAAPFVWLTSHRRIH